MQNGNLIIVFNYLVLNNYPTQFINQYIWKIKLKGIICGINKNNNNNKLGNLLDNLNNTKNAIISISCYCNISEIVKRLFENKDVKFFSTIDSRLDIHQVGWKSLWNSEKSNVVYKISCKYY